MELNAQRSAMGSRSFRRRRVLLAAMWFATHLALLAGIVAIERQQLLAVLDAESAALLRLASQRADQHNAHLTALSAVATADPAKLLDLFLEVAETIRRFYPRIKAVDLAPLAAERAGATTRSEREDAVDDTVRAAVMPTKDGALRLRPAPGQAGHYMVIKRSPNTGAAIYDLALEIAAAYLVASDTPFCKRCPDHTLAA